MSDSRIINEVKKAKKVKIGKSFKEYYQNPEFRERHLNYLKEKVVCECGKTVMRCNKTRHKKSKKHQEAVNKPASDVQNELKKMKHQIRKLVKKLK